MKPRLSTNDNEPPKLQACSAAGGGPSPRHVSLISFDEFLIRIKLESGAEAIICESENDLLVQCQKLAEERVPFSVGGMMAGPAEIMSQWQESGQLTISFLEISWLTPSAWQLREIVPGAARWNSVAFDDLISKPPILISNWIDRKRWWHRLLPWKN